MSRAVLRRVALAAAILLVPSVVVGILAARRSAPEATAPQPSAVRPEEPVTLHAALEPYQIVVFPGKLDPSAAPPADSCRSAMAAMRGLGGVPAIVGRLTVAFRVARTVQLSVGKVSIVTVRREHTPLSAVASCATPDGPAPWDPTFNEPFPFGTGELTYSTPVVRLADQSAPSVAPIVMDKPVGEGTFDLRAGATATIPVYVLSAGGPTFRTGFHVEVDLTVNGRARHLVVTDAGAPFWFYEANFRQGDGPILQWITATKSWRTL